MVAALSLCLVSAVPSTKTPVEKGRRANGGADSAVTATETRTIVMPADGAVLTGGSLLAVGQIDQASPMKTILVDGKPVETHALRYDHYARPTTRSAGKPTVQRRRVLVANVPVKPGRHEIKVGADAIQVWVAGPTSSTKPPAEFGAFTPHPPNSANCSLCHKMTESGGGRTLGPAHEPEVCFSCHELDEYLIVHAPHRRPTLAACRTCHAPHGGKGKALLIGDPKGLCLKCHEL